MVATLLKDRIVVLSVVLWIGSVALYVFPLVSESALEAFGRRYFAFPVLIPIVLAAWTGLHRLPDVVERRFWTVLGVGFAGWLVVAVPWALVDEALWTRVHDITLESGYLVFYLSFLLAVELRPHEVHTGSIADRERQLRTTGLTIFTFFVVWYFALAPAFYAPASYETSLPSLSMYVLLDLILTVRLLWMRRETWSVRWSVIYAWLAGGAALMLVGDAFELIAYWAGRDDWIASGTWVDHIWMLPGMVFTTGIRFRHVPLPAEQSVLNEPAARLRTLRAGHILLAAAVALPLVHVALYATGVLEDPATRPLREFVAMFSMIAMGGFAMAAYRTLEHERAAMEATELRLVNELNVARKMDAVARLAGSVAHDFNNLVQVVRGRAEIISQQIGTDSPLHEDVRQIRAAAARAADLASQLMTFGRQQQTSLQSMSLHDVLRRTEKLLKPLLDDRRRLILQLKASADVVRIDPLQFERIILNLATNARDAMPSGGTITIATFSQDAGGFGLTPAANRIILRVSDTGAGMDAETINHIFEPFFTTKQERGAGLGLAIVHGLVQQFGGTITVESVLGQGTTFTITLPLVTDAPVTTAHSNAVQHVEAAAPSAILIVEGDTTNRQLLRRLLSDLERPVLATATAAEAMLIAGRYSGPIALAVIDVTIENGRTLSRSLREQRSSLKVLLLAQDQPIDTEAGDELLREPFELSDVLTKAKELI